MTVYRRWPLSRRTDGWCLSAMRSSTAFGDSESDPYTRRRKWNHWIKTARNGSSSSVRCLEYWSYAWSHFIRCRNIRASIALRPRRIHILAAESCGPCFPLKSSPTRLLQRRKGGNKSSGCFIRGLMWTTYNSMVGTPRNCSVMRTPIFNAKKGHLGTRKHLSIQRIRQ